jgi:hypothetical protein
LSKLRIARAKTYTVEEFKRRSVEPDLNGEETAAGGDDPQSGSSIFDQAVGSESRHLSLLGLLVAACPLTSIRGQAVTNGEAKCGELPLDSNERI